MEASASAPAAPAGPEPSAAPSGPPALTLPSEGAARSPAANTKPHVIASPDMAAEGDTVTLEGGGFTSGERIRVSFRDSGLHELDLRDVTAGPDGSFAVQVRVDRDRDRGPGEERSVFRVGSLDDVGVDNQADTPFTYTE